MPKEVAAVICAAGLSRRMGGEKKEYRPLGAGFLDKTGRPLTVLGAATQAFASCPHISMIVITIPMGTGLEVEAANAEAAKAALPEYLVSPPVDPPIFFVPGGITRRVSVHRALNFLSTYGVNYVLIHDGARPWVDGALIERTIEAVKLHKAVVPVLPLVETPKELDESGFVSRHLRRKQVAVAQTPQAFAFPDILKAHEKASELELQEEREFTDDAEVWGAFLGPVAVIQGSPGNKKITFPEDLL